MKNELFSRTDASESVPRLSSRGTTTVKNTITGLIVAAYFASLLQAATYYVAPQGNDANPGTEGQPWRTLQHAANRITAGDEVIIMPGAYDERVVLPRGKSGSPEGWIVFRSHLPGQAFIKGFEGNSNNFIRIQGFAITYDKSSWKGGGIWLHGSHWEILDNYFYEVRGSAI